MRRRRGGHWAVTAVTAAAGLLGATAGPAGGATMLGPTIRVSVDPAGGDADGASSAPSISRSGRYVAFTTFASDVLPGDTNGAGDAVVRDLATGRTERVAVDAAGGESEAGGYWPSISGDGRLVTFMSVSPDLVVGDANGLVDVFVRDRVAGTTTRVSVDTAGGDPNGASWLPTISDDGRYVAYRSDASDLVTGDGNSMSDVFQTDLATGATVRVSVDMHGGDGDERSGGYPSAMSADGRFVAFDSSASDLAPSDGNGVQDVFVRDMATGRTRRVSVDVDGGDAAALSVEVDISADGRYVVFSSMADDLVPGDAFWTGDIFVRDVLARTTTKVSVDQAGGQADGHSREPSISADGRLVAFASSATGLAPPVGGNPGRYDLFIRDLAEAETTMVSVDADGDNPNAESRYPALSGDGRWIAFESDAPRMVPGDRNDAADVFARRIG